ncbi:hypothetical protein HK102_013220 [Quaeritorhiza haematococci]|nr:hypothetical protein HK102_013220 [Quaeritorhiza haematococci]
MLLDNFVFERVLSEDPQTKSIVLLGTLTETDTDTGTTPKDNTNEPPSSPRKRKIRSPAVICMEKSHFQESEIPTFHRHRIDRLEPVAQNDVYSRFTASFKNPHASDSLSSSMSSSSPSSSSIATLPPTTQINPPPIDAKLVVIHPATEIHIRKYTAQPKHLIRETHQMYDEIVKKQYIEALPVSRIQWVYNILDHKSEVEDVIFEDPDEEVGFMLLPDSKWDQKTLQSLYLLALCRRRDIASLRDLTASHLPLLHNMRTKIATAVEQKYGIKPQELRMFIHYQPSYYHFHIHVTHIAFQSPGMAVGQAHLLEDVIDNIENIDGDYYKRRTLAYVLGVEHPLYGLLSKGI